MPITINEETALATMTSAQTPEAVRAPDGRILGQFIPLGSRKMSCPEFGLTDEEMEAIDHRPDIIWRTPEEVMERLRQLRKDA
jgi:hypothetical protein